MFLKFLNDALGNFFFLKQFLDTSLSKILNILEFHFYLSMFKQPIFNKIKRYFIFIRKRNYLLIIY